MSDIKKLLKEAVEKKRRQRDDDSNAMIAREVAMEIANSIDPSEVSDAVTSKITAAIEPVLVQLLEKDRITSQEITDAIAKIEIKVPEISVPEIQIPEIRIPAPIVHVPAPVVNIPKTEFPAFPEFPQEFSLRGVDKKQPLPVMMMGADGKPASFGSPGIGGGKADFFTIKDVQKSIAVVTVDPDGNPFYPGAATGASSSSVSLVNADGTYYNSDNPLPVTFSAASVQPVSQVSGAAWSVSVNDVFGSTGANVINPDGRIKVELPTGSSGLTDTELRATAVPVSQVSGANWSTEVTNEVLVAINGSNITVPIDITTQSATLLTSQVSGAVDSVSIVSQGVTLETRQVSGAVDSVVISSALPAGTNNIGDVDILSIVPGTGATNLGKAEDAAHANGDTGVMALAVANESNTARAANNDYVPLAVDTEGNQMNVGNRDHDAVDAGEPLKIGFQARTSNPTAVANADRVNGTADDLGRQLIRPLQVRDLIVTAYASVTNGTETTLLAASAGSFHDLIMVVGSNNSDAAVSVDIRAVTGGNIVNTLRIPANGTAGFAPAVPWPQDATGNNWTVDGPDETGRTLTFSALFTREV